MKIGFLLITLSTALLTSPASGGGLVGDFIKGATGGAVDVERGEICAANQCVNTKGETRTKSIDEVIDDNLGRIPGYQNLSEADKANIRTAAKTGAVIAIATSDPITGSIIIPIIAGKQKEEVPVPSYKPNPIATDISYNLTADCIGKRGETSFTVAFKEDNADLAKVKLGDTVKATAPICTTVSGSVTSVTMKATSEATPVPSQKGFKWILLGDLKS